MKSLKQFTRDFLINENMRTNKSKMLNALALYSTEAWIYTQENISLDDMGDYIRSLKEVETAIKQKKNSYSKIYTTEYGIGGGGKVKWDNDNAFYLNDSPFYREILDMAYDTAKELNFKGKIDNLYYVWYSKDKNYCVILKNKSNKIKNNIELFIIYDYRKDDIFFNF